MFWQMDKSPADRVVGLIEGSPTWLASLEAHIGPFSEPYWVDGTF
jgi:hypothetical protein